MKVGDLIRCLYEDDDGTFGVGVVLKIYETMTGNREVHALWTDGEVCNCRVSHAEVISEGR